MLHLFNSHLPDETLLNTVFYIRNKDNASFVAVKLFSIIRSTNVGKEDTYLFYLYDKEIAVIHGSSFLELIKSGRVFTEENTQYSHIPVPAAASAASAAPHPHIITDRRAPPMGMLHLVPPPPYVPPPPHVQVFHAPPGTGSYDALRHNAQLPTAAAIGSRLPTHINKKTLQLLQQQFGRGGRSRRNKRSKRRSRRRTCHRK